MRKHNCTHTVVDRTHLDIGVLLLEVAPAAGDGAARTDAADQEIDLCLNIFVCERLRCVSGRRCVE